MGDHTRLSDDELLRRTASDPEAFGEFYDRHVRAVLTELRGRGLRTDEALDLTAEVFAAALGASRRYRPGEAPARAWLLGIARNKLAHRNRRAATEITARRRLGMARLVVIDERDYGNPDDGFQMEEQRLIPRNALMQPTIRLTYRDGHTRVARDPHQAK